jgi:hypothetical protein
MQLYPIGKMMCSGVLLTLPVRFVLSNMVTMPMKESVWNWDLLVRMKPKTWANDNLYELSDYILCFVMLMD